MKHLWVMFVCMYVWYSLKIWSPSNQQHKTSTLMRGRAINSEIGDPKSLRLLAPLKPLKCHSDLCTLCHILHYGLLFQDLFRRELDWRCLLDTNSIWKDGSKMKHPHYDVYTSILTYFWIMWRPVILINYFISQWQDLGNNQYQLRYRSADTQSSHRYVNSNS